MPIFVSRSRLKKLKGALADVADVATEPFERGLRGAKRVTDQLPDLDFGLDDVGIQLGRVNPVSVASRAVMERSLDPVKDWGSAALEHAQRPGGAIRGALTESYDRRGQRDMGISAVLGAVRGFKDPGDYPGRDLPGVRGLTGRSALLSRGPLGEAIGLPDYSVSRRSAVGMGAEAVTDPLTYVGMGGAKRAAPLLDERVLTRVPGAIGDVAAGRAIGRRAPTGARAIAGAADEVAETVATPFQAAQKSLLESIQREANIRRSGTAAREIAEGRRAQAGGIRAGIEQGGTLENVLAQTRQGAAKGTLRRTFADPLELAPEAKQALVDDLTRQFTAGEVREFDYLRTVTALQKTIDGVGLQPNEIALMKRSFGDEVANLAASRSKDSIKPEALTGNRMNRARQLIGRANAFNERGLRLSESNAVESQRAYRAATEAMSKADALYINEARAVARTGERASEKQLREGVQHQSALAERGRTFDRLLTEQERFKGSAKYAAKNIRAIREAHLGVEKMLRENPTDRMLLDKALSLVGEIPAKDAQSIRQEWPDTIKAWLAANRVLLDNIGETQHQIFRSVASGLSGNVSDSYATNLLARKGILIDALKKQGLDHETAKKVGNALQVYELKVRYPNGVPDNIAQALNEAKAAPYGDPAAGVMRGFGLYSQMWKNLVFGPADIGVFGQQVLHALQFGPSNVLAGTVNRTLSALHLPYVDTTLAELGLSKKIQYMLDGVPQGVLTGTAQDVDDTGTLFRIFGDVPIVKQLDVGFSAVSKASSDLQFGKILGSVRNLAHEGNLVALHLLGQDITDPRVRATSAEFANSITSFARQALTSKRSGAERGLVLTPSMRRAQVKTIMQLAKVFNPKATAAERTLGSLMIVNLAGVVLAGGKLVNDTIGQGEYEMDPSKPGFGQIVTPWKVNGRHIVVSTFPQTQIIRAIARSVRALAEGDPKAAAKAWGILFLGSAAPVPQVFAGAVGYGYQPGRGYRLGDLEGSILRIAPLPPIAQSYAYQKWGGVEGEFSPQTAGIEAFGFSAFEESPFGEVRRKTGQEVGPLFEIDDNAWKVLVKYAGGAGVQGLDKFKSYDSWRDAERKKLERFYKEAKLPSEFMDREVDAVLRKSPVYKAMGNARKSEKRKWMQANPQAALVALREGWLTLDKEEEAFLRSQLEPAGAR